MSPLLNFYIVSVRTVSFRTDYIIVINLFYVNIYLLKQKIIYLTLLIIFKFILVADDIKL